MPQRRRPPKTKKVLKHHAGFRAAQRYGLHFGEKEHQEAVRQIKSREAQFVERQSLRVTVWIVVVEGIKMKVCYDSKRKSIITCLPPESMNENQPE